MGRRLLKKAFCKHMLSGTDMTDSHIAIDAKKATGG